MMQQSEEFAASRLNQLGLNRKKNDYNQDMADYERGLRAKLERRAFSTNNDDSKSVKSSTSTRALSNGRMQVTFDEEQLKQQAATGKTAKWKAQLESIKERTDKSKKDATGSLSRANYARADMGGEMATNKKMLKLRDQILADAIAKDNDRHSLLLHINSLKR